MQVFRIGAMTPPSHTHSPSVEMSLMLRYSSSKNSMSVYSTPELFWMLRGEGKVISTITVNQRCPCTVMSRIAGNRIIYCGIIGRDQGVVRRQCANALQVSCPQGRVNGQWLSSCYVVQNTGKMFTLQHLYTGSLLPICISAGQPTCKTLYSDL